MNLSPFDDGNEDAELLFDANFARFTLSPAYLSRRRFVVWKLDMIKNIFKLVLSVIKPLSGQKHGKPNL